MLALPFSRSAVNGRRPHDRRTKPLIRFAPLAAADAAAVECLLDAAFGADRRGRTAYRLRAGAAPIGKLSFAAFDGDGLAGTLQTWPIALTPPAGPAAPLLLLGPIGIAPARQLQGIGRALIGHALAAIDAAGERATALIGDPEYYGRLFGFDAAPTQRWSMPGPVERRRLLVRLTGGASLPAEGMLTPGGRIEERSA